MKLKFLLILLLCSIGQSWAQKFPYTDYKPEFRNWQDNYILDRIVYTEDRTILHFRFIDTNGGYAVFYGPGAVYDWLLMNTEDRSQKFKLKEIRNIKSNNKLLVENISDASEKSIDTKEKDILTCEVHFERLPNTVKVVDLIEGEGKEANENHFNCFDVRLKTWDDATLGRETDMKTRVEIFNMKQEASSAKEMLALINDFRSKECYCGDTYFPPVEPLEWSDSVALASKNIVLKLYEKDGMTSNVDNKNPRLRLNEVGLYPSQAHENISYGFELPQPAFYGWTRIYPHCVKMRSPIIKTLGAARMGKYWSILMTD
ncbi:MAG: hypothetical protein EAZ67_04195 [Cytophagales bacterium]|nr:MAG: hypothetical protein EAZ67_04195 [Cytophagales bacterium]